MATRIDYEAKINRLEEECHKLYKEKLSMSNKLAEAIDELNTLKRKIAEFAIEYAGDELPLN